MNGSGGCGSAVVHRYPKRAIQMAALRAAVGLAIVITLAVASGPSAVLAAAYAILFAVFLAYAGRTFLRGTSTVVSDESGLTLIGPRRRSVAWSDLTGLRLAFYATRRDGEDGWMELIARGPDGAIRLDSDITDFAILARRCREAAASRALDLTPATLRNFEAVVDLGDAPSPDRAGVGLRGR